MEINILVEICGKKSERYYDIITFLITYRCATKRSQNRHGLNWGPQLVLVCHLVQMKHMTGLYNLDAKK